MYGVPQAFPSAAINTVCFITSFSSDNIGTVSLRDNDGPLLPDAERRSKQHITVQMRASQVVVSEASAEPQCAEVVA